tara:strand:+ start:1017 stop:1850 length:834 start_codon:yes stop_codon:yes gene_type:complete
MVIEVSHESPISILKHADQYNDYGYALVHLFETHPEYYNHYRQMRQTTDTPVLLDNSIFELGKAFDRNKYVRWIESLEPNYYIVPDVLENVDDTIQSWKDWMLYQTDNTNYLGNGSLKIGAVQGKTWNDLVKCYQFMGDNADYIAISFDYNYYEYTGRITTTGAGNKLQLWCTGRQRFISQLIDEGIWRWDKPHHLLGCSLAKEFKFYVDNNIHNIKSVDTSNPVVAGIKNLRYNETFGLEKKPSCLLADLIDHQVTDTELEHIFYNTRMFKKIINR